MKAVDWIYDRCPCLSQSSTVRTALARLGKHREIRDLPLRLSNGKFGGFFSADQLPSEVDPSASALSYCSAQDSQVQSSATHYEVFRVSQQHQGLSVAVVDKNERYLGTVSPRDMIVGMKLFSALRSPGAVISLRLRQEDYSLSELAQLIESNQAKILDLTLIQLLENTHEMLVVLKLSCQESSAVRATLQRYGYEVLQHQSSPEQIDHQEKKNYEALMKYLDL